jgi:predicted SAM-dependent methyltransferase
MPPRPRGDSGPLSVLAVGCGADRLPQWQEQGYTVVRMDIDPRTEPDIVADMTAMGDIGPFDAVFSSHSLEHLYPHDVPVALREFYRVLRPGGAAVILVPDLEGVPATDDVLPGSRLTGLHLYYGDASVMQEHPYMAHHCGFVESTLRAVMEAAGFTVKTSRMTNYNLLGMGVK